MRNLHQTVHALPDRQTATIPPRRPHTGLDRRIRTVSLPPPLSLATWLAVLNSRLLVVAKKVYRASDEETI